MYIMGTILRHGSQEQKLTYLPQIAAGALRLQAFGVTEPTAGSDTTRIQTTAVQSSNGYVVSGQKIWTSRALHSDLMLLLARTIPIEKVEKRTHGLSTFLVDIRAAQEAGTLTIRPIKTLMNHATTEIFLDGVELAPGALIGEEGKGFQYILDGMNAERILIAAECIGDGRWFVGRATKYASERVVFQRPIGQNQGVHFRSRGRTPRSRRRISFVTRPLGCLNRGSRVEERPTWRSSSLPRHLGRRRTHASHAWWLWLRRGVRR